MFQKLSLERLSLALFASAFTLVAATAALAKTPVLDQAEQALPAVPVTVPMRCQSTVAESQKTAEKTIEAKFIIFLKSNYASDGAAVVADELGTCGANAPSSAYNVIEPRGLLVDVHNYVASGATCKENDGSVLFTVYFDRKQSIAHTASLTIRDIVYNCEL